MATMRKAGTTTGVTLALCYSRVSTVEQHEHGVSLAAQVSECRRYAAGRGWIVGTEYQDVMSGRKDARPGYQAMLAEMRALRAAGTSVAVVVADFDRLGRRVSEILRFHEETSKLGVEIHAPRKGGKLDATFVGALAFIAGVESSNTSARVKATRADLEAGGWAVPGRPAWGYRWRDSTPDEKAQGAPRRVLDLDPDQAPFVRELYARVVAGASLRRALRWIAGLPATARGGRAATSVSGVRKTLSAPVYVSRFGNGEDVPGLPALDQPKGRWPAIVDEDVWAAAQRRFASHAHTPLQASGTYLLTGFLRCATCEGRMDGDRRTERNGTVSRRYRCQSRSREGTCTASATAAALDELVMDAVQARLSPLATGHPTLRAALARAWADLQPADETAAHRRKLARLEAIVSTARQRLARANDRFVDGDMRKDQYDASCERYADEIEAAERELATVAAPAPAATLPPLDVVLRTIGGWVAALDGADVPARRDVLRELIVAVHPRRLGTGRYAVDIAWTAGGDALATLAARAARATDAA